ncbi:MAG: helix-turn-helix domain-containing protein [Chloroflexi bacterium]|nr:helix-turn-helix domain-containing protein [Chloroflexota bacterium]
MTNELEGYLNVQEAAQRIKRSTEQVRRYLREGKLEGKRIGGQWFIRESVVAYLVKPEENAVEAPLVSDEEEMIPMIAKERKALFERISARRLAINERWEKTGVTVDTATLVNELREEAS